MVGLVTVGHGAAGEQELLARLRAAGVAAVVDVRRFPGSRRHPQFAREHLGRFLLGEGVAYRWDSRLGGRRRVTAEAAIDTWWQVAAFRAYAVHMRTAEFATASAELWEEATQRRTAVLCSEAVWWRCHRRLIADAAVLLQGIEVDHLLPGGRAVRHQPAAGARVTAAGLVYR